MDLIEAIKTGKAFRRSSWLNIECYYYIADSDAKLYRKGNGISPSLVSEVFPRTEDLLAEDWEIEEEKLELTKDKIVSAICQCGTYLSDEMIAKICEDLGFKE